MDFNIIGIYISLFISILIAVYCIWKTFPARAAAGSDAQDGTAQTKNDDYFTGSVTEPKRFFFSVFATTFSAFTVVGLPAMFYVHGVGAFLWMGIGIALTPLTLHFIGKRIVARKKASPAGSVIGLLMDDYGSRTLTVVLSIVTVLVLFPYLTLQIAGVGKFLLSASDGNISYSFGAAFVCLVVGAYVVTGGAKADVETDYIQGPILIVGVLALGGVLLFEMFGSYQETYVRLETAGLTSLPGPKGYFSIVNLISFGIIFTLISISTPQVSQKLMGSEDPKLMRFLISWYALIGLIVVFFAGLVGLYAASRLQIATPDFVAGDVLRTLVDKSDGIKWVILFVIASLFVTAVISAALSTIDSLLLAISAIVSDNLAEPNGKAPRRKLKPFSWAILVAGFILSANPPVMITQLASIQLSGLTALLPCLLGPLYGFRSKLSGWAALVLGMLPIFASLFVEFNNYGVDNGVIGLALGILGLLIGRLDRS